MKRTWIAVAILTLTVTFCISGFFVVEAKGKTLIKLLTNCTQEIMTTPEPDLTEIADKINKEWSSCSTLFKSIFIHDEFSEIETVIRKLHVFAYQNDADSFYEQCNEAITKLQCALDDEKPKFENIF